MKLLLDTHALLWWLDDDQRLGLWTREVIADPANDVIVSAVSVWEIVVKVRLGKLRVDLGELLTAIDRGAFTWLGVLPSHLHALLRLPLHHRDPFDHLLIAQAITEQAAFVSKDAFVSAYPVWTIGCSDMEPPSSRP